MWVNLMRKTAKLNLLCTTKMHRIGMTFLKRRNFQNIRISTLIVMMKCALKAISVRVTYIIIRMANKSITQKLHLKLLKTSKGGLEKWSLSRKNKISNSSLMKSMKRRVHLFIRKRESSRKIKEDRVIMQIQ